MKYIDGGLDFVDLLANHNRIVLADLISPKLTIVKTAIVLVAVTMSRTKQAFTSTFETYITIRITIRICINE